MSTSYLSPYSSHLGGGTPVDHCNIQRETLVELNVAVKILQGLNFVSAV